MAAGSGSSAVTPALDSGGASGRSRAIQARRAPGSGPFMAGARRQSASMPRTRVVEARLDGPARPRRHWPAGQHDPVAAPRGLADCRTARAGRADPDRRPAPPPRVVSTSTPTALPCRAVGKAGSVVALGPAPRRRHGLVGNAALLAARRARWPAPARRHRALGRRPRGREIRGRLPQPPRAYATSVARARETARRCPIIAATAGAAPARLGEAEPDGGEAAPPRAARRRSRRGAARR